MIVETVLILIILYIIQYYYENLSDFTKKNKFRFKIFGTESKKLFPSQKTLSPIEAQTTLFP